jgi:hypothetical protein
VLLLLNGMRGCAKKQMAYRISDADELVNIDNGGSLEVVRCGGHGDGDAGRRNNGNHRLGDGLVLGRARHG